MLKRIVSTLLICGLLFCLGLCTVAAKTESGKQVARQIAKEAIEKAEGKTTATTPGQESGKSTNDKAKDALKDIAKELGDKVIDRVIPGGDNKVAKDIAHDLIDGNPRAVGRALLEPSQISPKQGEPGIPLTMVKPEPRVVPASPANENAIPANAKQDLDQVLAKILTTVHELKLVPANPSNQNAEPVHGGGGFAGLIERSVTPSLPKDVGRTVVHPANGGDRDRGLGGHEGGGHEGGGWAGPDHGSHSNVA